MDQAMPVNGSPTSSWDYASQPQQWTNCPVCERANVSHGLTDRVGYAIGVSGCVCGLRYLNPRLTAESYAQFYASGAYRDITTGLIAAPMAAYYAQRVALERVHDAKRIALMLTHCQQTQPVDVLDVGGGDGATMQALTTVLPMQSITILDPSPVALDQATEKGYHTICASAEDRVSMCERGGICCVRTLDHLCDPIGVLRWWRSIGTGWLWLDVVLETRWKIDHPLYWSKASLWDALHGTGWQVKASLPFAKGKRLAVLCG